MRTHRGLPVESATSDLLCGLRLVRHFCDPPCGDCPPLGIRLDECEQLQKAKRSPPWSDVVYPRRNQRCIGEA